MECGGAPINTVAPGNWGRWGPDDEAGTFNLLEPSVVKSAAGLVKTGRVYSLAMPLDGPIWPTRNPPWHMMTGFSNDPAPGGRGGADDMIVMHTQTSTHLDGLCHIWYDSMVYNGYPADVVGPKGAEKCGVNNLPWLVGRGVLLDIAAMKGVDHLDDHYPITVDDLDRACHRQSVEVRPADILLVRTGWMRLFSSARDRFYNGYPGLCGTTATWLLDHDVAAVGADNGALEVWPLQDDGPPPIHSTLLRDMGAYIMEYLNLEELAADGVHEFLFAAAPLRIPGGIGSPLNPLAIT